MMKINKLEIENVKRVRALTLEPAQDGLTVIGGKNGEGKTSVLDAIAWALGGDKYRPAHAQREGSVIPPVLRVELSNGVIVERKGKNSALTVTDPRGEKAGQSLLDAFVEKLALDLPRFMAQSSKEKADTLLKIIGVEEELRALRLQEQQIYNKRHAIGQIADQKAKFAKEQISYPNVPPEPVAASELILQQQDILIRNGQNQLKREKEKQIAIKRDQDIDKHRQLLNQMADLNEKIIQQEVLLKQNDKDWDIAKKDALDLRDESTAELENNIRGVEEINRKVRANLDKDKAQEDAREYTANYEVLSAEIDQTREAIMALLAGADLPLPELGVDDQGELTYKGFSWGDMSSSEQLRVATAIVRKLNPQCEFVLIDKLEQMDVDTMKEFGAWLEAEKLQAICTRVSTGAECSLIIEDGMAAITPDIKTQKWEEGKF